MILVLILFEFGVRGLVQRLRILVAGDARLRPIFKFAHDVQLFHHHVDQLSTRFVRTYEQIRMREVTDDRFCVRT